MPAGGISSGGERVDKCRLDDQRADQNFRDYLAGQIAALRAHEVAKEAADLRVSLAYFALVLALLGASLVVSWLFGG
jgi:hypothetical protein